MIRQRPQRRALYLYHHALLCLVPIHQGNKDATGILGRITAKLAGGKSPLNSAMYTMHGRPKIVEGGPINLPPVELDAQAGVQRYVLLTFVFADHVCADSARAACSLHGEHMAFVGPCTREAETSGRPRTCALNIKVIHLCMVFCHDTSR